MKDKTSIKGIIMSLVVENILRETIDFLKGSTLTKSSIDVGEFDSDLWSRINRELYKLSPEAYSKMRVPTQNKQFYELEINARLNITLRNKNWISVRVYKDGSSTAIFSEKRMIIKFHGTRKHQNKMAFVRKMLFPERDAIKINYTENDNKVISNTLRSNGWSCIVLPQPQKDRIVQGLQSWNNSTQWYNQHGLTHKIGVLLYGKPGTGKSSIVKAISKMFRNATIVSINPDNVAGSIRYITQLRRKTNGTIIVLIEDFDMYCPSREDDRNPSDDNIKTMVNQNMIFQLLDGVYSTEDTIYIATTNHIDKLDPAIIRYGRFDIQEELDYFDEELSREFVANFYNGDQCTEILESLASKFPIQPSFLQSEVMRVRTKHHNERT